VRPARRGEGAAMRRLLAACALAVAAGQGQAD